MGSELMLSSGHTICGRRKRWETVELANLAGFHIKTRAIAGSVLVYDYSILLQISQYSKEIRLGVLASSTV